MKFIVYVLKDPRNDKIKYVGKTSRNRLQERFKEHLKNDCKKRKVSKWIKELLDLKLKPIIEVIDESNNEEDIFKKEKEYIKLFNKKNLLNMTDGGDGPSGYKMKIEVKKSLPQLQVGYKKTHEGWLKHIETRPRGDAHHLKNRKQKEETKIKISARLKGKTRKKKVILCVETNETFNGLLDAERKTGIGFKLISKSCNTNQKTHGLHFKYINSSRDSKYRGVSRQGKRGLWRARIQKDGKEYDLGSFLNEDEAARAYDKKAKELFGNKAKFNFKTTM